MQLLRLRYYQLRRDLGYWVFVIMATVFFFAMQLSVLKEPYPFLLPAVVAVSMLQYHLSRRDLNFIGKYLNDVRYQLLLNYNLLILPLSLGFIFSIGWPYSVLMHVLVSFVVFAQRRSGGLRLLFISRFVPPAQFEWISGLRTNFFPLAALASLALLLSPVKLFAVAALFLVNVIFLGFYNFYEPLVMLNPDQSDISAFLKSKTNFLVKMVLLVNVPVLIINTLFHPGIFYFNLFFLLALLLLGVSAVYIKYAGYSPNQQQAFNIDYLVLFASVFLPYFLPLGLLICYNNRKKARLNLTRYLDDQR